MQYRSLYKAVKLIDNTRNPLSFAIKSKRIFFGKSNITNTLLNIKIVLFEMQINVSAQTRAYVYYMKWR